VSHLLDEVESLVHDAQRLAVPLMCGFVERHNPAVATARSQLPASPEHLVALRHSPAPGRSLGSVVGDLLIHDLDLAVLFAGEPPDSLQATGTVVGGVVEAVDVLLAFPSGARAALSASRRAQRKVRSWFLTGGDVDIELDLVRQDVTCFRHRDHSLDPGLAYRAATEVEIPFVRHGGEPLDLQLRHFLGLLHGSVDPGAELASILPAHRLAAEVDALLPVPEAAAPLRALRRGTVAGLGAGS
jgi:predicted dehydrogenase